MISFDKGYSILMWPDVSPRADAFANRFIAVAEFPFDLEHSWIEGILFEGIQRLERPFK